MGQGVLRAGAYPPVHRVQLLLPARQRRLAVTRLAVGHDHVVVALIPTPRDLHQPTFLADESAIAVGVRFFAEAALA